MIYKSIFLSEAVSHYASNLHRRLLSTCPREERLPRGCEDKGNLPRRCNFLESDPENGSFNAEDGELARKATGAATIKGPPSDLLTQEGTERSAMKCSGGGGRSCPLCAVGGLDWW